MSTVHDFVEKDNDSSLQITCVDQDGTVIDLTNCTVRIFWRYGENGTVYADAMTNAGDPTTGVCSRTWETTRLQADLRDGTMYCEFEITDSSGNIITSTDETLFKVRKRIKKV